LKYFLCFRIFEQLALALKTEFALNFSSQGAAAPLPRTPLVKVMVELPYISVKILKLYLFQMVMAQ